MRAGFSKRHIKSQSEKYLKFTEHITNKYSSSGEYYFAGAFLSFLLIRKDTEQKNEEEKRRLTLFFQNMTSYWHYSTGIQKSLVHSYQQFTTLRFHLEASYRQLSDREKRAFSVEGKWSRLWENDLQEGHSVNRITNSEQIRYVSNWGAGSSIVWGSLKQKLPESQTLILGSHTAHVVRKSSQKNQKIGSMFQNSCFILQRNQETRRLVSELEKVFFNSEKFDSSSEWIFIRQELTRQISRNLSEGSSRDEVVLVIQETLKQQMSEKFTSTFITQIEQAVRKSDLKKQRIGTMFQNRLSIVRQNQETRWLVRELGKVLFKSEKSDSSSEWIFIRQELTRQLNRNLSEGSRRDEVVLVIQETLNQHLSETLTSTLRSQIVQAVNQSDRKKQRIGSMLQNSLSIVQQNQETRWLVSELEKVLFKSEKFDSLSEWIFIKQELTRQISRELSEGSRRDEVVLVIQETMNQHLSETLTSTLRSQIEQAVGKRDQKKQRIGTMFQNSLSIVQRDQETKRLVSEIEKVLLKLEKFDSSSEWIFIKQELTRQISRELSEGSRRDEVVLVIQETLNQQMSENLTNDLSSQIKQIIRRIIQKSWTIESMVQKRMSMVQENRKTKMLVRDIETILFKPEELDLKEKSNSLWEWIPLKQELSRRIRQELFQKSHSDKVVRVIQETLNQHLPENLINSLNSQIERIVSKIDSNNQNIDGVFQYSLHMTQRMGEAEKSERELETVLYKTEQFDTMTQHRYRRDMKPKEMAKEVMAVGEEKIRILRRETVHSKTVLEQQETKITSLQEELKQQKKILEETIRQLQYRNKEQEMSTSQVMKEMQKQFRLEKMRRGFS